ncbi:MAG: nucleoside deaminase [Tannerella sp.]|jgi:guanine deaminase|nr:nucleoside deaminase [Tannerella sp.]
MDTELEDKKFIQKTVALAAENVQTGKGGPFAALVVKNGQVVSSGTNLVTSNNDPTAHAEITAIRNACEQLGEFQLDNCTLYTSCEPCPMCLGAIYWARPKRLVFAAGKQQAAEAGFDDVFIYRELELSYAERSLQTLQIATDNDNLPFELWIESENKTVY